MPVRRAIEPDPCSIPGCGRRVHLASLCLQCYQLASVVEVPSDEDPDSIERAIERRRRLTPEEIAEGCAEHEARWQERYELIREREELEALFRLDAVPPLSEADMDWLDGLLLDAQADFDDDEEIAA